MAKSGDAARSGGRLVRPGRDRSKGRVFTTLGRTILDRLDRGVVLMDARGKVVDANTLATHVIRNCSGIMVRAGRLAFTDPALEARLKRAMAAHKPGLRNGRALLASRVRCKGGAPYRIVIRSVPPGTDERDVAFFALLYAPNGLRSISIDVLRELYGLTPAQAGVARHLFAGLSVEETARALDLSLNTVRTHLKQIFTKCEVNSQAELLHLLALGPHEL